jgi:hypothetical protein
MINSKSTAAQPVAAKPDFGGPDVCEPGTSAGQHSR